MSARQECFNVGAVVALWDNAEAIRLLIVRPLGKFAPSPVIAVLLFLLVSLLSIVFEQIKMMMTR